ncbi:murein endopeptidase [Rhizobium sp. ERR 922]|uniref:penicillin-insensitive murein endopeptidase n=1 Tax=Rhizobium TaxID=379 RepID=UPI00119F1E93|nr:MULTISPECIES: penicillin-insensitive murein endopeptidase [Rhizobium]TWB47918.1 murein endopeptidase [Rhizobium sp. ERR 922]TWB89527.1 murein endopeptidase [Rhizobium sp. ERR 942]GES46994.1 penicillin-insensitive murein endopeptidase [Rhizobium dioscoreae]
MASLLARAFRTIGKFSLATLIGMGLVAGDALAQQATPSPGSAKAVFGAVTLPTQGPPQSIGFYAKGCLAGAVALPADGPTWQAMRLSRNRRWGRPEMIGLLERLSRDAAKNDGWPGLLVGDISQPRGGPMINGHASHQIGLDADVWLTPMPRRKMTAEEREALPFTTMLAKDKFLTINDKVWTPAHARLLMRAASYPEVERIFVNPAIKKKMCETWTGDRTNLGKLRPEYGHDSHFHIRLRCPAGSIGCTGQAPVAAGDGCDKSLAWWFGPEPWAKPKPSDKPPQKPREVMVADLPKACQAVLAAPAIASARSTASGAKAADASVETDTMPVSGDTPPGQIPQQ